MKSIKKILGVFLISLAMMLCALNSVKAEETTTENCEYFKQYLNDKGEFELKSTVPTSEIHFAVALIFGLVDENLQPIGLELGDWYAKDFSKIEFVMDVEDAGKKEQVRKTCRPNIKYVYDENVKTKIDELLKDDFKNKISYTVEDIELVDYQYKYFTYYDDIFFNLNSTELFKSLDYKNVDFKFIKMFFEGGDYLQGYTLLGQGYISYDGVTYFVSDTTFDDNYEPTSIIPYPFFYVPSETKNTSDDIEAAAQKRVDDYLGKSKIKVTYLSTARKLLLDKKGISTYDDFAAVFEEEFSVAGVREDDLVFDFNLLGSKNNDKFSAIIRRDSSKMIIPTMKTVDLITGIEINSNANIAMDAKIKVKELTSGSEYEKIIGLLNLTDSVTYDIKLYSDSLKTFITKLENGTFEVKIPIPEKLKGKSLAAYYINEDGKIDEYEVTIKDGYAIFKTNHFSIYTLGTKDSNNIMVKNPDTSDNIGSSILIGAISLIGLVGTIIFLKKKNILKVK